MRTDLELTNQQIFDKVVAHLRQQHAKAQYGAVMFYHTLELRCPIGIFIPEDLYTDKLEHNNVLSLSKKEWVDADLRMFFRTHMPLLRDLQRLHDNSPVDQWEQGFQFIAAAHYLLLDGEKVDIDPRDNPWVPNFAKPKPPPVRLPQPGQKEPICPNCTPDDG